MTDAGGAVGNIEILFTFGGGVIENHIKNEDINITKDGLQGAGIQHQFSQEFSLSAGTYTIRGEGTVVVGQKSFYASEEATFTVEPAPVPVPEPLTILGSGVALGFGALFKKEHSRKQKKNKSLEKQKA